MHIHFIAIGGSAMHNLALALSEKGEKVTGSDDVIFEPSKSRLEEAGLLPQKFGWFPEKISDKVDAVILGMHAKKDNPELLKAQHLEIPIYSYPEFLYEQAKNKSRVVIGGSHGKTSITAMILHVLKKLNMEVDFMVGAQLENFGTMVHLTEENEYMVLEGDEYLSSPTDLRPKFHLYQANIALISGIAWDHINVFPTFDIYVDQFVKFIDSMAENGILVYNHEDEIVREIAHQAKKASKLIPYSLPDFYISKGKTFLKTKKGDLPINIFGNHNLSNLAGAQKITEQMGISQQDFYEAIADFKGASKRLEKIAENEQSIVFKDFAHSPSKVKATTKAVRDQFPDKNLIACFELHTYSSLNSNFLEEYKNALQYADEAVVFYSSEAVKIKRLEEIDASLIKEAFYHPELKVYTEPQKFQDFLKQSDFSNSVLLLMSSGNYGGLDFEELKTWL